MKSIGAFSAILAVLFSTAEASTSKDVKSVPWPENGSVKFSTPMSPMHIAVDLKECAKVYVNFRGNKVQVNIPGDSSNQFILEGQEKLRADGGQLVVAFSYFGGQGHVIVNAEDVSGNYETRMHSFTLPECKISRVRVTGLEGHELQDIHVGISEEIVEAFKAAYGQAATQ